MSRTYVCPDKDIVCGDKPATWCAACPKRSAHAINEERERCARICEAEAKRARALMNVLDRDGKPIYDNGQLDAGACALEHAASLIRSVAQSGGSS